MKNIFLLFFILSSIQLSAQFKLNKIKVGILSGYAFYGQEDLTSVNQSVIKSLPFEVSTINDFDPVFFFGAYSLYGVFGHFSLGPAYEYHYIGSRLGAKDYSGTFSYDQFVHTHQAGLKVDYSLITLSRTVFNVEIYAGANFTYWKIISNLQLGNNGEYSEHYQNRFKGLSWNISPAFKIEHKLFSQVYLLGAVSYSYDLKKKYHNLQNMNLDVLKTPDWKGLKLSLGLEFNFK